MKKYIKTLLLILITIILCGCGKKLEITKCNFKSDQSASSYKINTKYTIYSYKDIVEKVDINQVITSSNKNVLKEFKQSFNSQYKLNSKTYGGYEYKMKIKKNKLTLNVTIDYTEFNMKKFVNNNKAMQKYINKDKKLTLKGIKQLYKTSGTTCESIK